MELEDYYKILDLSRKRVRDTKFQTKRFLVEQIDWRDRLIAIVGSRGTGKTTLILQHIKDNFSSIPDKALYVSLDNIWFETHSLIDLVDIHSKQGGTHVFIDEIHHQQNWQRTIKNIYDNYPDLNVVYTGSSLLRIDATNGDLSRRQITYPLPGLSFREFLFFEGQPKYNAISLQELIKDHVSIATKVTEDIKVLKFFEEYLKYGYYPFYKDVYAGYEVRLSQITNQILESDYPAIESINYTTVQKIKRMLYILAQSCPQTPNMSSLYEQLDTDRNQGLKMLYILDKANLLNLLSSEKNSLKNLSRPDKIYCDNTNLMHSLVEKIDIGTRRETFFLNQIKSAGYTATYPKQGDFIVDNKYIFEVGGSKKTFAQIKDIKDSYLAIDNEEVGRGNRIPLWMFGFLY